MCNFCVAELDTPVTLAHFAESAVRAYKIAMTPPMEPVVLVAGGALQEEPVPAEDRKTLRIPKLAITSPPAGDPGAVADLAKWLVNAENPAVRANRLALLAQLKAAFGAIADISRL